MNLSKNANSRLWDALLKELLIENMNMQVADLSGNDAPMPSESFEKNISKIARSVGRKEAARNAVRLMKNGAIMIAAVLSISFCILLTQPKVYAAVSDVIKTAISGGFDKYTFSGDNAEFDSTVRLGYVPQNYELRNAEFAGNAYASLIYVNKADEAKGKDEADEIKLDSASPRALHFLLIMSGMSVRKYQKAEPFITCILQKKRTIGAASFGRKTAMHFV